MACPDKETLLRFVDDEVESREREQLRLHVGECGDCRAALDEIRAIDAGLRAGTLALDESATGCFDSMALARYRSGALGDVEREKFEAHLGQCATCVERVTELDSRMTEPLLKTPDRLLQAALNLEESRSAGLLASLRRWFESLGAGRMTFAGAGACAVILLAVFLTQLNVPREQPPGQTPSDPITKRGGQKLLDPNDIVAQTTLVLSNRLKAALAGDDPATNSAGLREIIANEVPQIPVVAINIIEIDGGLSAAIRANRELPDKIAVILDNKGTLWIHAER